MKWLLGLLLVAGEGRLDGAAFEADVAGYTVYYGIGGVPAGAEQYLPGQRARWMAADGSCVDGVWWQEEDALCFLYEGFGGTGCWYVSRMANGGLHAHMVDEAFETGYEEMGRDQVPLPCVGPDVGV